ncbi:hypothetical protein D3C86_1956390 [compost metagenome]
MHVNVKRTHGSFVINAMPGEAMPRPARGFTDSSRGEDEGIVVTLHAKILSCDRIEGSRLVVRA